MASPITGPAGNHEYLLWLRRSDRDGWDGMGDVAGGVFEAVEQLVEPEQIKTLVANTLTPRA